MNEATAHHTQHPEHPTHGHHTLLFVIAGLLTVMFLLLFFTIVAMPNKLPVIIHTAPTPEPTQLPGT